MITVANCKNGAEMLTRSSHHHRNELTVYLHTQNRKTKKKHRKDGTKQVYLNLELECKTKLIKNTIQNTKRYLATALGRYNHRFFFTFFVSISRLFPD